MSRTEHHGGIVVPRRVLVVSPHLDDGVLSVGGTIAQFSRAGSTVTVATLFTGPPPAPLSPAARAFHQQCGLGDDAMQERKTEDVLACAIVGAAHRHLGLPEALYRVDASRRHRHGDGRVIFDADPSAEPEMIDAVGEEVRSLRDELDPDLVVAPLGVGHHVDHVIANLAVRRCGIEPARLRWFEDIPYILYPRQRGWTSRMCRELLPEVIPMDLAHWDAKITAVACYDSQLEILWHEPSPWRQQLHDYATKVGGDRVAERLWRSGPNCMTP